MITLTSSLFSAPTTNNTCLPSESLFDWSTQPKHAREETIDANKRLENAIKNPEYLLTHWVELPTAPKPRTIKAQRLTLREAILLSLRYNPNIQNAELDRIIQRYQLRLAENQFELQYALAGTAQIEKSNFTGVGSTITKSTLLTPELGLKTKLGTDLSLKMDNNVAPDGNYNPLLNFSITQPLLQGFGKAVNEVALLNAKDAEWLNKLNLQQAVMDQITQVITSYRALILSGNNLQNERHQLEEAQKTYDMNERKIKAGQLEPTANIQQSYQVESLNLMVEQAENDFINAAQDLLLTIGLDPSLKLEVPSDVTLNAIVIPDRDKAIQQALTHNTQFLALKMALRADKRAYLKAKNQQLWQLNLKANVQTGTYNSVEGTRSGLSSIYNGRNLTESAGVTLTIPIRDLNRREQLISAKVQLEKARLNVIAAERTLITNVTNTINNIKSLAKRYDLALRQVKLAAQSYSLEKKKQQAGIASSLDVSNTQNQLLQAQSGLINAKIAYLNQLSTLQRILGTTLDHWNIQLRYCG